MSEKEVLGAFTPSTSQPKPRTNNPQHSARSRRSQRRRKLRHHTARALRSRQLRYLQSYLRIQRTFDAHWFERNPNRRFRIRIAHWSELAARAARDGVLHRQFGPGWFIVAYKMRRDAVVCRVIYFPNLRPEQLSDAACRVLFCQAERLS
jgi:hypothetical protein